ncbi:MAG: carbonic anhydrase family protein [Hyphomonadaceae bacterium]
MSARAAAISCLLATAAMASDAQEAPHPAVQPAALKAASASPGHAAHWTYDGETGPTHWSELSGDNTWCSAGHQQSPINIASTVHADAALPAPTWSSVAGGMVVNNGHTIEVDISGAGGVAIGDKTYVLKQFHFHHPSEHTINGRSFPLEAHLVHAADDGRLAVVSVMFDSGPSNPLLDQIWGSAPVLEGKSAVRFDIDPAELIPRHSAAYRYEGSLTTPPCSETVTWTVMAEPATASPAQLAAFAALFPNNARPVQPLNRRYVLLTE